MNYRKNPAKSAVRESGVRSKSTSSTSSCIRHGKVCKVEVFRDRADALEAAGLSE